MSEQLQLFPFEKIKSVTESFEREGGGERIHIIKGMKDTYSVLVEKEGIIDLNNSVKGGKEILEILFEIKISI